MIKQEKLEKIIKLLKRDFFEVNTPLLHQSVLQLVIATMMSAQTLDATVNKVTPILFEKYKTLEDFINANPPEISELIRLVNYHTTKSKNIVAMAKMLKQDFQGIVPHTIEELTTLPGVGRKTANVVISEWFAKDLDKRRNPVIDKKVDKNESAKVLPEGFVVDTHVLRTSYRLGLTKNKTPEKVEQDLMKLFPREEWNDMSLRLIFFGRTRCKARNDMCHEDKDWSELCINHDY